MPATRSSAAHCRGISCLLTFCCLALTYTVSVHTVLTDRRSSLIMGTLTADCPRLDTHCDHKLATSCRLTSTHNCCACADERAHSLTYRVYIDGIGFVQRGTRWQGYCWFCKGTFVFTSLNACTDRLQSSGVTVSLPLNLPSRSHRHASPRYQTRKNSLSGGSSSIRNTGLRSVLMAPSSALQLSVSPYTKLALAFYHGH